MKQFFGKKSRSTLALVIMASLALHIIAAIIFGTIQFVEALREEEKTLQAVEIEQTQQQEKVTKVNVQQRTKATPPPRPPAITVNRPTDLSIPELDIKVDIDLSSVQTRSAGSISSSGISDLKEMAIGDLQLTAFGYSGRAAGTLEGTLIDLKRDKSGKPLNVGRKGAIREFSDGTWRLSRLTNKFYSAENKLYGSYWMIPSGPANRAPKSFGVENEIEPTGIIAYYEGTFTPTEAMNMRFVGIGDDVLIVRLDSKIVFDGSWSGGYSNVPISMDGPKNTGTPQFRSGPYNRLTADREYDLKILIAEIPGGGFMSLLFYQLKGEEKIRIFSTKPMTKDELTQLSEKRGIVGDTAKRDLNEMRN